MTIGHNRITIGHSFFSISKHKANTTELHPKVRQTCLYLNEVTGHIISQQPPLKWLEMYFKHNFFYGFPYPDLLSDTDIMCVLFHIK